MPNYCLCFFFLFIQFLNLFTSQINNNKLQSIIKYWHTVMCYCILYPVSHVVDDHQIGHVQIIAFLFVYTSNVCSRYHYNVVSYEIYFTIDFVVIAWLSNQKCFYLWQFTLQFVQNNMIILTNISDFINILFCYNYYYYYYYVSVLCVCNSYTYLHFFKLNIVGKTYMIQILITSLKKHCHPCYFNVNENAQLYVLHKI